MMRSYSRGGAGTVYWLTLPVPRRGNFKPIYRAVNTAIRRAARSYPDTVRIVDAEAVFTPGRRYTLDDPVRRPPRARAPGGRRAPEHRGCVDRRDAWSSGPCAATGCCEAAGGGPGGGGRSALAGCGSDPESKPAATAPDDSVVLGTDPVPTPTQATTPRRTTPARSRAPPPAAAGRGRAAPPPRAARPGDRDRRLAGGGHPDAAARPPCPAGRCAPTRARAGRSPRGCRCSGGAGVPAGSVLAFSLFTNDPPGATAALEAALRGRRRQGRAAGLPGVGHDRPTRARRRAASRPTRSCAAWTGARCRGHPVVVADWAELVARRPALLAPDGVHGTPAGYRARARPVRRRRVRRCPT